MVKEFFLDLLFPPRCVICDEVTDDKARGVCKACTEKIAYIKPPFCMKCGKQVMEGAQYCKDCLRREHRFIQGMALYDYAGMSGALYRFKYAGRSEYARFFGRELAERGGGFLSLIKPDALVPVPIHTSRKRMRGYNQAELIARELSRHTKIPVNCDLVTRIKKTLPQRELSESERQNNLKKAFKILQNDVKLSTIVIVDDIYTTGSTIDAMAEALFGTGVKRIYYMALAIGRGC